MSIKPKYVKQILLGNKKYEIRKRFPKDYRGWIYIYCTKGNGKKNYLATVKHWLDNDQVEETPLNGKVVGRFWCDNVSMDCEHWEDELLDLACLTRQELYSYTDLENVFVIHIKDLERFDIPGPLKAFSQIDHYCKGVNEIGEPTKFAILKPVERAPQSWQYIEIY